MSEQRRHHFTIKYILHFYIDNSFTEEKKKPCLEQHVRYQDEHTCVTQVKQVIFIPKNNTNCNSWYLVAVKSYTYHCLNYVVITLLSWTIKYLAKIWHSISNQRFKNKDDDILQMWFSLGHLNHAENKNRKWEHWLSYIIHNAVICV